MKLKILFLLALFLVLPVNASNCDITCPSSSLKIIEEETFFKKITGLNFVSKKIAETIIQKELNEELNSKIKANLEIYTIKRLKNGEFKSLTLQTNSLRYKAFSMSNFYAQTVCPHNQVIYEKNKLYYPNDLAFKYQGKITNQDIKNIINSKNFKEEIIASPIKVNEINVFEIKAPIVIIKNNKVNFEIPIKSIFGNTQIKFSTNIEVKNNKLVLKNINFNSKNTFMNNDIFIPIIDKINPISYQFNSINGKYCKIFITNAKISDNIINTEGVFIINKNYDGEK